MLLETIELISFHFFLVLFILLRHRHFNSDPGMSKSLIFLLKRSLIIQYSSYFSAGSVNALSYPSNRV